MPLIYSVYSRLPKEETYNLIGQMKRAGLSISNNLAKGAEVARSSVLEIDKCLVNCLVLHFVTTNELNELNPAIVEIGKLISALIESNNR